MEFIITDVQIRDYSVVASKTIELTIAPAERGQAVSKERAYATFTCDLMSNISEEPDMTSFTITSFSRVAIIDELIQLEKSMNQMRDASDDYSEQYLETERKYKEIIDNWREIQSDYHNTDDDQYNELYEIAKGIYKVYGRRI